MSGRGSAVVEATIQRLRLHALTATKTELHKKLTEFERDCIRKRINTRNALTCTEPLQEIEKQLNQHARFHYEVNLEKLSVHSDSFERIIQVGGMYTPLLQKIKESYDNYVLLQLKHEQSDSRILHAQAAVSEQPITESVRLRILKSRVRKLEEQYELAVEERKRLNAVLLNEKQTHLVVMENLKAPPLDSLETERQDMEASTCDYSAKIEGLQMQIAIEQENIQSVMTNRKEKVPISVCYQLEHCVREVELEIQKLQKQCETLEDMIREAEEKLSTIVTAAHAAPEVLSKLWQGLHKSISSEL